MSPFITRMWSFNTMLHGEYSYLDLQPFSGKVTRTFRTLVSLSSKHQSGELASSVHTLRTWCGRIGKLVDRHCAQGALEARVVCVVILVDALAEDGINHSLALSVDDAPDFERFE